MSGFFVNDIVALVTDCGPLPGKLGSMIPAGTAGRVVRADGGFMVGVVFGRRVLYVPSSRLALIGKAE